MVFPLIKFLSLTSNQLEEYLLRLHFQHRLRLCRLPGCLKLVCFVILPVFENTAIYHASSSGHTEVTTLLQIQCPNSAPTQNGGFLSSLTPTAISEAVAARGTVRSSAVMDRLLKSTEDRSSQLSIPTLPALLTPRARYT